MAASHETPTDEELVLRAQTHDIAAFEQLFHRHYVKIHAFAFRCCLDYTAAQDIAQETFIKAARALPELRENAAFSGWLYRIARNATRDWQRRDHRRSSGHEAFAYANHAGAVERSVDHSAVAEALCALAPDLREAVVLTFYEEMSHADAVRIAGCAEATISWRVFRAKRKLRQLLTFLDP